MYQASFRPAFGTRIGRSVTAPRTTTSKTFPILSMQTLLFGQLAYRLWESSQIRCILNPTFAGSAGVHNRHWKQTVVQATAKQLGAKCTSQTSWLRKTSDCIRAMRNVGFPSNAYVGVERRTICLAVLFQKAVQPRFHGRELIATKIF